MKRKATLITAIASAMLFAAPVSAADEPATWEGLVKVDSKKLDLVYLQPGADFRGYTKVMLDPTDVGFQKGWQRDYNSSVVGLNQISDYDIQKAITKGIAASSAIFAAAFTKAGYTVVTTPGPDVLRISTGVENIVVSAPILPNSFQASAAATTAGSAAYYLEARDSVTNDVLGRAVDQKVAGDDGDNWRTAMSNKQDFTQLVQNWADVTVNGLNELKALSPIKP